MSQPIIIPEILSETVLTKGKFLDKHIAKLRGYASDKNYNVGNCYLTPGEITILRPFLTDDILIENYGDSEYVSAPRIKGVSIPVSMLKLIEANTVPATPMTVDFSTCGNYFIMHADDLKEKSFIVSEAMKLSYIPINNHTNDIYLIEMLKYQSI